MPLDPVPAMVLLAPMAGHPTMVPVVRAFPAPREPVIIVALPAPVPAHPDVVGPRRRDDHLHAVRRRTTFGVDDAQGHRTGAAKRGEQCEARPKDSEMRDVASHIVDSFRP